MLGINQNVQRVLRIAIQMTQSIEAEILELKGKICHAELERDLWKSKPSEHYKMACLLVESLKKQLVVLLAKNDA